VTLPGIADSLPVRFLPLAVHVTVLFRPTVAPAGIGIVFQIVIKLPIDAPFKCCRNVAHEFEKL
jgi:hypothetical protein